MRRAVSEPEPQGASKPSLAIIDQIKSASNWLSSSRRIHLWLSLILFVVLLAAPSRVACQFDGMPWSSRAESFLLLAALPFLLLLGRGFLKLRASVLILLVLLIIKLCLGFSAPQAGWQVWSYPGGEQLKQNAWPSSYESIWHPERTATWLQSYTWPYDFPLEWLNCEYQNKSRLQVKPIIRFSGIIFLPPGQGLAVAGQGFEWAKITAHAPDGSEVEIPLIDESPKAVRIVPQNPPQGTLWVEGVVQFKKVDRFKYALDLRIIDGQGHMQPAFGRGIVWMDESVKHYSRFSIKLMRAAAKLVEYGLFAWFGIWLLWCLCGLVRQGVLEWRVLLAIIAAWAAPWLLVQLGAHPLTVNGRGLAWAFGLLCLAWLSPWPGRRPNIKRLGSAVLLIAGPLLLAHYMAAHWHRTFNFELFSFGNDWLTYQCFAREIVFSGGILQLDRGYYTYQPLYRFFVALGHTLFGQSNLSMRFLDVWAVLAAASLIAHWGRRLGLAPVLALLGSGLYLYFDLTDRFLLHIGNGLQEHAAMLFMMLAGWALFQWRDSSPRYLAAACLLGMAALLIRMDHIGVLVAMGLFLLPVSPGGFISAWQGLLNGFWRQWKWPAIYWASLAFALGLVVLRNGLVSGNWVLMSPTNVDYLQRDITSNLKGILELLNASRGGFASSAPMIWAGSILGLLTMALRPKVFARYPLCLGICLAGLIAPYMVFLVNAYPPRFSIHLMPLAALSVAAGLNSVWIWAKEKFAKSGRRWR